MQKKVLLVSTVASTIGQFNMDNICILQKMGYEVYVAANFKDVSAWPQNRIEELQQTFQKLGVTFVHIDFSRSPTKIKNHVLAYRQICKLIRNERYCFIHTHTPIASAIARVAAHKFGTKIVYTAHGYHFFEGAPIKNWLVFYPIEKLLSRYTDIIININEYDYALTCQRFHPKAARHIRGVGIDIKQYRNQSVDRNEKRSSLGIKDSDFVMLSVGELNDNKNHMLVLKAMTKISNPQIRYYICGEGVNRKKYEDFIKANDLSERVKLLGFRRDVFEILHAVDCFVFPSVYEGLPVSVMEAMGAEIPIIVSDARGCTDLIKDRRYIFDKFSIEDLLQKIEFVYSCDNSACIAENTRRLTAFSKEAVNQKMTEIYQLAETL